METKICACCGQPFIPRRQAPHQTFCSEPDCQRERRRRWQRKTFQSDPAYRDNQARSQRAWLDRNPDYWRKYRGKNAGAPSNGRPQMPAEFPKSDLSPLSGLYRIRSIPGVAPAKSDAWIVEITPVCQDCPCKKDACKDRT